MSKVEAEETKIEKELEAFEEEIKEILEKLETDRSCA
jgi:peptidoglycan hydrolase CwlO-like protein